MSHWDHPCVNCFGDPNKWKVLEVFSVKLRNLLKVFFFCLLHSQRHQKVEEIIVSRSFYIFQLYASQFRCLKFKCNIPHRSTQNGAQLRQATVETEWEAKSWCFESPPPLSDWQHHKVLGTSLPQGNRMGGTEPLPAYKAVLSVLKWWENLRFTFQLKSSTARTQTSGSQDSSSYSSL